MKPHRDDRPKPGGHTNHRRPGEQRDRDTGLRKPS
jgi:hypothetical protein